MTEVIQPVWIDVTSRKTADGFVEQFDQNSHPASPWRWRHRLAGHTGEPVPQWIPGRAPLQTDL